MSTSAQSNTSDAPHGVERRKNPRLRELVDEMLASIRAAHKVDLWTDEERARYQADMARIMASVREHAIDHASDRS
jgi:hypothetical protein